MREEQYLVVQLSRWAENLEKYRYLETTPSSAYELSGDGAPWLLPRADSSSLHSSPHQYGYTSALRRTSRSRSVVVSSPYLRGLPRSNQRGTDCDACLFQAESPILPILALFGSVILNALFYLMRYWSVDFRLWTDFRPASVTKDADAVLVSRAARFKLSMLAMYHTDLIPHVCDPTRSCRSLTMGPEAWYHYSVRGSRVKGVSRPSFSSIDGRSP